MGGRESEREREREREGGGGVTYYPFSQLQHNGTYSFLLKINLAQFETPLYDFSKT